MEQESSNREILDEGNHNLLKSAFVVEHTQGGQLKKTRFECGQACQIPDESWKKFSTTCHLANMARDKEDVDDLRNEDIQSVMLSISGAKTGVKSRD